jgi:DNA-binding response OmpR family regulator
MIERSPSSSAEPGDDKRGSTILIVDDEPFNVDLLEQELDLLGYQTISAVNGQEALEHVAEHAPDLILLDVMMPVMDGFTVCKTLKENEQTRLIPVVIMTALGAVEDRIKGIEAGADDFLTKPVDDRELQARIRTALKQKHAVEEKLHVLGQVRDHLGKFVPEAVKRLVEENPTAPDLGKQERDVSVLFVDIVGYSRLSEQYDADVINQLVQSYFSAFIDRIHADGGDITETSGDGLMVVFQDPDPDVHTQSAMATALHLFETTESLNQQATLEPLQLHMGLNSDVALVGSTRFEGSSGARWVFTADGPAVNLAARLAALAEPGQILLTAGAVKRLRGRYPVESLGQRALKNIVVPVEIFSISTS